MRGDGMDLSDECGTSWWQKLPPAERLALVSKLVSRFNHDLRTPLNTLTGWTHLLERSAGDVARTQHGAEVIARNVREQTVLLQEFAADAAALLDTLALHPEDVNVADLLETALQRLQPALALHEVAIDVNDGAPGSRVYADSHHLARLIYRLLLLAVRRAPHRAVLRPGITRHNGHLALALDGEAQREGFEELQLLDLRIASAVAGCAGATLDIYPPGLRTHFCLKLRALH